MLVSKGYECRRTATSIMSIDSFAYTRAYTRAFARAQDVGVHLESEGVEEPGDAGRRRRRAGANAELAQDGGVHQRCGHAPGPRRGGADRGHAGGQSFVFPR